MSPPPLSGRGRRIGRSRRPALLRRLTLSLFAAALIGTLGAAATGLAAPSPVAAFELVARPRGRLPRPFRPALGGRVLRLRDPELRPDGSDGSTCRCRRRRTASTGSPRSIDALPQVGSWAEEGETWAPSVAYDSVGRNLRHVLHRDRGVDGRPVHRRGHLAPPARAPTRTTTSTPVVCQDGVDTGLDRRTTATTGAASTPTSSPTTPPATSWLIWKSDGNHIGTEHDHLVRPARRRTSRRPPARYPTLLQDDQPWQSGIIEGPGHGRDPDPIGNTTVDDYYLFYSGSDEGANTYSIGWATCPGPSSTSPGPA